MAALNCSLEQKEQYLDDPDLYIHNTARLYQGQATFQQGCAEVLCHSDMPTRDSHICSEQVILKL